MRKISEMTRGELEEVVQDIHQHCFLRTAEINGREVEFLDSEKDLA